MTTSEFELVELTKPCDQAFGDPCRAGGGLRKRHPRLLGKEFALTVRYARSVWKHAVPEYVLPGPRADGFVLQQTFELLKAMDLVIYTKRP